MKTIKELEADLKGILCGNRIFKRGKIKALKDVLELIDERLFICPAFREWERKQAKHYLENTTELERFIYWIKRELKARIEG